MKILCETYYLGEYHDKKRRLNGFSAISGIVACDFRKAYNRCFREKTGKKASDSVGKFPADGYKVSDSVGKFLAGGYKVSDSVGKFLAGGYKVSDSVGNFVAGKFNISDLVGHRFTILIYAINNILK